MRSCFARVWQSPRGQVTCGYRAQSEFADHTAYVLTPERVPRGIGLGGLSRSFARSPEILQAEMTIGAIWLNDEDLHAARLWMATDSRISDREGKLIDEGLKLYELPVLCLRPGASGLFDTPFYSTSIGMACAGSSLIYQHVYGTLVPILGSLIGDGSCIPAVAAFAVLAAAVTSRYVRSLGQRRHDSHKVEIVVGGQSPGRPGEAYILSAELDSDGLIQFVPSRLALDAGDVHFIGQHTTEASALLRELQAANEPGAPAKRAALNVIRRFIDDPDKPTIGGEVQIGYTVGTMFRRAATVVPEPGKAPKALSLLNSINLDELPPVGPCRIGIQGMITP